MTTDNNDLFLSYAAADHGWVLGFLAPALDAAGLRYATESVGDANAPRLAALEQGARQSRHTLLVLSPDYLGALETMLAGLRRVYGPTLASWPVTLLIHRHVTLPASLAGLSVADATDPLTESGVLQVLAEELRRTIPAATPPLPRPSNQPSAPTSTTPAPVALPPVAEPPPRPAPIPLPRAVSPPPPSPSPAANSWEEDEDVIWPRMTPKATAPALPRADVATMPGLEDDAISRAANVPPPPPLLPAGVRRFRWLIFGIVLSILLVWIPSWGSLTRSVNQLRSPTSTPTVDPRVIATQQAQLAPAQHLAAQALSQFGHQPAVGLLLAVEAYRITDTQATRYALFSAVQTHIGPAVQGTPRPFGRVFTHYNKSVSHLAASDNGQLLAGAAADDTIVVWNTSTHEPIAPPLTGYNNKLEVVRFIAGDWLTTLSRDDKIIAWDLDKHPPATLTAKDIYGSIYVLNPLTSPDDRLEATVSDSGDVVVNARFGPQLGTLPGSTQGKIEDVAFSPDSRMLATAGTDGSIRFWDAATLQPIGPPFVAHSGETLGVAFAPNGTLLSSGADDIIMEWDASPTLWIQDACAAAGRNLTPAEWQQFLSTQPYRLTCPNLP